MKRFFVVATVSLALLHCESYRDKFKEEFCRTILTSGSFAFEQNSPAASISGTISGSYDIDSNTQTVVISTTTPSTSVFTYDSYTDFVDEGDHVGYTLAKTKVTTGGSTENFIYTYDDQKRLAKEVDSASGTTYTYTAWDSKDRPTAGTYNKTTCVDSPLTYTHDDASLTSVRNVDATNCGTQIVKREITYDSDKVQTKTVQTTNQQIQTTTITVSATKEFCK